MIFLCEFLWHAADAGTARELEERILQEGADTVAAFVFEPVQGDGGAIDMHRDFFLLVERICRKYGILMIADEIMSFAKTGHWFGMELYGVCQISWSSARVLHAAISLLEL